MSILIDGATYRFENRADGNRSLNVYGTSPAILSNVCMIRLWFIIQIRKVRLRMELLQI